MSVQIIRGNALDLPIPDGTVDLVVTSPPYFGLRSYQDGGEHYDGQIGSEATPAEFVDALLAATREMVRVLKPSGSIWVNLGDKYSGYQANTNVPHSFQVKDPSARKPGDGGSTTVPSSVKSAPSVWGIPNKSLMGIPWRYALRCIDDLGLILRAEVIWAKPNGLPESVTDRVRRSHEQWFHLTKQPRYYSAVDEIREEHAAKTMTHRGGGQAFGNDRNPDNNWGNPNGKARIPDPLGKLPGSVWTIPTQPLTVPPELGVDHFAAFPMEWPRRIIRGWSPPGVCVECGEGRRPVAEKQGTGYVQKGNNPDPTRPLVKGFNTEALDDPRRNVSATRLVQRDVVATITGYACACPEPTAPTTPATILDPFGGTGTTALVAHALGRHGISVDMSADYCRLAEWRTTDPGQLAAAMQVEKPPPEPDGMESLFDMLGGDAA